MPASRFFLTFLLPKMGERMKITDDKCFLTLLMFSPRYGAS